MTRHIHPGHVAFSMGNTGDVRPSQIRRRQRNAGSRWICSFCGQSQFNREAVTIHQKVCEYRNYAKRAELHKRQARKRRWEGRFDALYDFGFLVKAWVRRALVALHWVPPSPTVPVRGPEPTYPHRTRRLLDSVAAKYGRPSQ
jgi:hypothetical protein